MEKIAFFQTYLLTFLISVTLTVGLIFLINKGLRRFFEYLSQDNEIARFFVKLTNIIILLGGLGAALTSGYNTSKDANWLTLTWDAAEQLENSLGRLFLTLIIFAIVFFVLHIFSRRMNK
jgi:Na+/phosphate symporter